MTSHDKDYKYLAAGGDATRTDPEDAVEQKQDEYRARPAWRNQWFAITVALLLFVLFVYVGFKGVAMGGGPNARLVAAVVGVPLLVLVAVILYRHHAWTFTVRGETIESCRGIIGRDVQSIRIQDLRNVNVRQGIFQRLFGVGDVEFSSAGGSGVEVTFYGVTNPLAVRDRVLRAPRA